MVGSSNGHNGASPIPWKPNETFSYAPVAGRGIEQVRRYWTADGKPIDAVFFDDWLVGVSTETLLPKEAHTNGKSPVLEEVLKAEGKTGLLLQKPTQEVADIIAPRNGGPLKLHPNYYPVRTYSHKAY